LNKPDKIFVDAMVWIGAFDDSHENHMYAKEKLSKYLDGASPKSIILSDYVFNETLSYITRRQKDRQKTPIPKEKRERFVRRMVNDVYNSSYVKIIPVKEEHVAIGLELMKKYPGLTASLTDWTSLILMEENQIPVILTFDKDIGDAIRSVAAFKDIKVWTY
jgi:predicted nucleic acid-binding protein